MCNECLHVDCSFQQDEGFLGTMYRLVEFMHFNTVLLPMSSFRCWCGHLHPHLVSLLVVYHYSCCLIDDM